MIRALDARQVASGLRLRVLAPLALGLLLLVSMVALLLGVARVEHGREQTEEIDAVLKVALQEQHERGVKMMRSLLEQLMQQERVRAAFLARDRDRLLQLGRPLLGAARERHLISHLYFILPDRTALLRVHEPDHFGDRIDRFVQLEAERTGAAFWGNEQGPNGAYTLRVTVPWKEGGKLIGYLEMGLELEDMVADIKPLLDADLVLVLDKSVLDQQKWAHAQRGHGRPESWNEYPGVVILSQTMEVLPAALKEKIGQLRGVTTTEMFDLPDAGRNFQVVEAPLTDVRGRSVGTLILLHDASAEARAWRYAYLGVVLLFAAVGGALMLFFNRLLRRVEMDVAQRSESLAAEQEQRQRAQRELGAQQERNELLEGRARMVEELEAAKRVTEEALRHNEEITAALRQTQGELLATARQAGRAEIATNVLHNVGNVLNSVNTSTGVMAGTLRKSRLPGLAKAVQLLQQNAGQLGDYLTRDEKGRMLPGYIGALSDTLAQEQQALQEELRRLTRSVEHITEIVSTQQSHARPGKVVEPVQPSDLAEDALRLQGDSLARHQVNVVREFGPVPVVPLDRGSVLQILVNLISNAKTAMSGLAHGAQRLTLRVEMAAPDRLRFSVRDEGEGIAPENLTRIFAHGFTTRATGHGFGLHSSALAASQLGGSLTAHSDGPGLGATFVLELPVQAAAAPP